MRISLRYRSSIGFFARHIKSENEEIRRLTENTRAFRVKLKSEKAGEEKIGGRIVKKPGAIDLLARRDEGWETFEILEHGYRFLCFIIAEGVPSESDRLYRDCSLLELYKLLMIKRAIQFESERKSND